MFLLFRRLCTVIGFLVLCLIALFLARNLVAKWALCWLIPRDTTFECRIDQAEVAPVWPLHIHLQGVTIENPPDFADHVALEISQAWIEVAPEAWQNHQLNYRLVDIEISRFNVVNSEPGGNNLTRFATVAQRDKESLSGFYFDSFQVRVTDPRYFGLRRYRSITSLLQLSRILTDILHK